MIRRAHARVVLDTNVLLAALKTSSVDYLITGDKDLLAIDDRYPIVTPATSWATPRGSLIGVAADRRPPIRYGEKTCREAGI